MYVRPFVTRGSTYKIHSPRTLQIWETPNYDDDNDNRNGDDSGGGDGDGGDGGGGGSDDNCGGNGGDGNGGDDDMMKQCVPDILQIVSPSSSLNPPNNPMRDITIPNL